MPTRTQGSRRYRGRASRQTPRVKPSRAVLLRRAAILAGAATIGAVALAVQYVLWPTPLPPPGEYFLTELARSQIGIISVPIALASAWALGFFLQAQSVFVGLIMLWVFPVISLYEGARYPGSHNLIPFEMAFVATWGIPMILAAWLGGESSRRTGRRSIWNGTED